MNQLTEAIRLLKISNTSSHEVYLEIQKFLLPYSIKFNDVCKTVRWGDMYIIEKQLINIDFNRLPDKPNVDCLSIGEWKSLIRMIGRRKRALKLANLNPTSMLENINEKLIELDVNYPNFDVLKNDMSKSLLKYYISFIYDQRPRMRSNNIFNPTTKRYLQINTEISCLRSLYQSLFGLESMVKFCKPINDKYM